jgi:hypothetical protein
MLASGAERLPILSRLTSFSPPFGAAVRHRKARRSPSRRVVARRRRLRLQIAPIAAAKCDVAARPVRRKLCALPS